MEFFSIHTHLPLFSIGSTEVFSCFYFVHSTWEILSILLFWTIYFPIGISCPTSFLNSRLLFLTASLHLNIIYLPHSQNVQNLHQYLLDSHLFYTSVLVSSSCAESQIWSIFSATASSTATFNGSSILIDWILILYGSISDQSLPLFQLGLFSLGLPQILRTIQSFN